MWTALAIVAGLTGLYALPQNVIVGGLWLAIAAFAYRRRKSTEKEKRSGRLSLRSVAFLVLIVFGCVIVWAIGYYPNKENNSRSTAQSVAMQQSSVTLPRPTANVVRVAAVETDVPATDILQVTSEGVRLTLKQIEFRDEVDGDRASNGVLAVFLGEFRADSSYCVSARDIRLILDDVAYAPDRGWMHAVQGTLKDRRNYPGPIGGQCLDPNVDTLTFFVFDVPDDVGDVQLRFVNETVDLSIDWGVDVVNIESTTPLPSNTKTQTRTKAVVLPSNTRPPTQTRTAVIPTTAPLFTPQAGVMMTVEPITYYVISSANVRECASTDCDIVTRLSAGSAIVVDAFINGESVDAGNAIWYRVRYNGRDGYVYSNLVSLVRPTTESGSGNLLPTSAQNTPAPLVSTPTPGAPIWSCDGDRYNCGDFANRTDLMSYFNACPGDPSDLDGNENGIPCE